MGSTDTGKMDQLDNKNLTADDGKKVFLKLYI